MNSFTLSPELFEAVNERLSNKYIGNLDPTEFVQNYNGYIPLNEFVCVVYGMDEAKVRQIEFIQFLGCTNSPKFLYQIYLFNYNTTKWIIDNKTLRGNFFKFKVYVCYFLLLNYVS